MKTPSLLVAALVGAAVAGSGPAADGEWGVTFTDVAREAGLVHPSIYGGVSVKRFIIETNGCGTALVDYDSDGWLDALVLSGTRLARGARHDSRDEADRAPSRCRSTSARRRPPTRVSRD